MANTIKLAANATTGNSPDALALGEVAINTTDKKLWVGTNDTLAGNVLLYTQSTAYANTDTNTTYTASTGLHLSGTDIRHSDTSTQVSVNGTGRTYIQDVTLDTYGHVTSLGTATETVTEYQH